MTKINSLLVLGARKFLDNRGGYITVEAFPYYGTFITEYYGILRILQNFVLENTARFPYFQHKRT